MPDELIGPCFRVFYRRGVVWTPKNSEVVWGRAALARVLARKIPAVIHHEVAIIHRCVQCGGKGAWDRNWMCYPVWDANRHRHNNAGAEVIYCSRQCWIDATGGFELPPWMDTNQEPNRDQARQNAWWDANTRERDRKAAAISYRRVPLPPWPGGGSCKWCGLKINEDRRRSWHAACLHEYFLHSDLSVQTRFLIDRDGRHCAWPSCTETDGLEVDHRTPLWKVRHLPDDERRPYYGPKNLWRLCDPHHGAKTKAEAAERAAERAVEASQIPLL